VGDSRLDTETDLMYYRMRFYHTGLGRFVSRDPLEYVDGMGLHEYVHSGPIGGLDPWGEWEEKRDKTKILATATPDKAGETVKDLAKKIGLESQEFRKWLTLIDGKVSIKRATDNKITKVNLKEIT